MQVLFHHRLFDLIFALIYSESGSLRCFFQRLFYHWFQVWGWFSKFKFHNITESGYSKFKIWHDVKHIAVSPNLNSSMSTITVKKIKNYLNWRIFELGTKFNFSFWTAHILSIYQNTLMLAFYSWFLKDCWKITMVRTC